MAGTVVGAFILSVISAIALPLFRASLEKSHKQIKRLMPRRVTDAARTTRPQIAVDTASIVRATSGKVSTTPLSPGQPLGSHRRCTACPPQITQGPEGPGGCRWNSHHLPCWSGVSPWHPVSHGCCPFEWNERSTDRYFPSRVNCRQHQGQAPHEPETERPTSRAEYSANEYGHRPSHRLGHRPDRAAGAHAHPRKRPRSKYGTRGTSRCGHTRYRRARPLQPREHRTEAAVRTEPTAKRSQPSEHPRAAPQPSRFHLTAAQLL